MLQIRTQSRIADILRSERWGRPASASALNNCPARARACAFAGLCNMLLAELVGAVLRFGWASANIEQFNNNV